MHEFNKHLTEFRLRSLSSYIQSDIFVLLLKIIFCVGFTNTQRFVCCAFLFVAQMFKLTQGGSPMPLSVFIEMTLSAILTVWSPGPNNILLLSTASKYGISGNIRFMTGIWSGSLTLMCLSGLFCSTLGKIIPGIQPVMKYLGAAYVLYLAWQTWRRIPPSDNVQDKKPTWLMGFFLQLINVKIIIYGLTMFSAYILPYEARVPILFCFAVYLMFLGALGNLIWAFAGNVLKRFYSSHYKLMNGIMALLLVWCSLRITGIL